ncbi:MAG: hypothetical protein IPN90_13995 [Elusimicrobia bacterium]|nr:hypothetical protein [Elusimicrobiota bacterium]
MGANAESLSLTGSVGSVGVSSLMRRVMTGYAVGFNRRHKRVGHLFQNRYKSVVCEEERYLLELVRTFTSIPCGPIVQRWRP